MATIKTALTKSERNKINADLLHKSKGNLDTFRQDKKSSAITFANNFVIYDDEKQARFKSVKKVCKSYQQLATEQKTDIENQLKKIKENESKDEDNDINMTDNNKNKNKNKKKQKDLTYNDLALADALYLLSQVAASKSQADPKLFAMDLSNVIDKIYNNLFDICDKVYVIMFAETNLIGSYEKIIFEFKGMAFINERDIMSAFSDAPKPISVANNLQAENFVQGENYSLLASIRQLCEEKEVSQCIEFIKLTVDATIVDMYMCIKWILCVLIDSLDTFDAGQLALFDNDDSKKEYIKITLKEDLNGELWILTEPFKEEGAPEILSGASIEILYTAFMDYMDIKIDQFIRNN